MVWTLIDPSNRKWLHLVCLRSSKSRSTARFLEGLMADLAKAKAKAKVRQARKEFLAYRRLMGLACDFRNVIGDLCNIIRNV